jgi:DNA-binding beta-propeller fold protein YncE
VNGLGVSEGDTVRAARGPRPVARMALASFRGRSPLWRAPAFVGVVLAALLLSGAPASAIEQRGHAYSQSLSFGAPGKGDGDFKHPAGIAVDDATGDFYVADRENDRIQEFEPKLDAEGKPRWVREFKVPYPVYVAVDNSTAASDPSKGDVYVIGSLASEKKEAQPSDYRLYKFNAAGGLITKISKIKLKVPAEFEEEFERLDGVAVDSSGSVWVDQEEELFEFNNEEKNKAIGHQELLTNVKGLGEEPTGVEVRPGGLAFDSQDHLYAGIESAEESIGASAFEEELTGTIDQEDVHDGLIEEGQFAVAAEIDPTTGHFEHPELDPEYTTAIAVNPVDEPANGVSELNDIYITNVASVGGQDATTIAAFNSQHELIQRFSANGLQDGDGIAVDSKTGTVYVSDGESDRVDVFELEPRGAPTVGALAACTLGGGAGCPTSADATTLQAQVDPEGAQTHYHFEYGAGSGSCAPATPCTSTPEQLLAGGFAGFADESAESPELPELPSGVYHYRVIATNAEGEVTSAEATFTIAAAANGLPDHRSWELVSPVQKEGAEAESISVVGAPIQASADGDAIAYITDGPIGSQVGGNRSPEFTQEVATIGSEEWSSQDVTTANQEASGVRTGVDSEYRIFSSDLALALIEPYPGQPQHALAEPPLSPPLTEAEKGHQEKTVYLRADGTSELLAQGASQAEREDYAAASEDGTGYLALVSALNAPGGEPFGGGLNGDSEDEGLNLPGLATPDLSHVIFESRKAAPGIYEWGPKGSCTTEEEPLCTGGDIQPVSVLPGQTKPLPPEEVVGPIEDASVGGAEGWVQRHAISDNGGLVFWTGHNGKTSARHLYVRDTDTHESLQLDEVISGSGEGNSFAQFQDASADGSRVFFTDTQRLTAESKAREDSPDLYVAELSGGTSPEDPLTDKLTDLTPEGEGGESADVQLNDGEGGGVLGASEDGSYVYFVADGRLAPGAESRGSCGPEPPPGTTCGLYVRHYESETGQWEKTKLIAILSSEDEPDWGSFKGGDLAGMTSRVSPNGNYLAFMSDRSLTGYDNIDLNEATGRHADEEVYLYDASDQQLVCASCNPSGERPHGVYDQGAVAAGGQVGASLVIDRPEIWAATAAGVDHWLAGDIPGWTTLNAAQYAVYQSRYLSNEGRLFFDSPDELVPAVREEHAGKEAKVYEYQPEGVGSCESEGGCVGLVSLATDPNESAFVDASENGDDVFFVTASKLVQQDADESYDVYDARVCEPASRCLPAPAGAQPPCHEEEECRGKSPLSSPFEAPASEAVSTASVSAQHEVLGEKVSVSPKPTLTRAQKLAKALKSCKRDKKRRKRVACERAARKAYGPSKAKKSSATRRPR